MLDTIRETLDTLEEEGIELQGWGLIMHTADGELFMLGAPDEDRVGELVSRINDTMSDMGIETTHDEPIVIH